MPCTTSEASGGGQAITRPRPSCWTRRWTSCAISATGAARPPPLYLGDVRLATGDYPAATHLVEQALGISRDIGDRLGQAWSLLYHGIVRRETGDYPAAAQLMDEALGIFRDLGNSGEAGALNEKGTLHRVSGDLARARRATSRPWNRPAPSPSPGPRLAHSPAWAAAPSPSATPNRQHRCCGTRWESSSGSARPRPPTLPPNSTLPPSGTPDPPSVSGWDTEVFDVCGAAREGGEGTG